VLGDLSSVNGILAQTTTYQGYIKDQSSLKSSLASTAIKTNLNKTKDDIKLSYTGTDADAPTMVWTEFYKYTDSSVINNYLFNIYSILQHINQHVHLVKLKINLSKLKINVQMDFLIYLLAGVLLTVQIVWFLQNGHQYINYYYDNL